MTALFVLGMEEWGRSWEEFVRWTDEQLELFFGCRAALVRQRTRMLEESRAPRPEAPAQPHRRGVTMKELADKYGIKPTPYPRAPRG